MRGLCLLAGFEEKLGVVEGVWASVVYWEVYVDEGQSPVRWKSWFVGMVWSVVGVEVETYVGDVPGFAL